MTTFWIKMGVHIFLVVFALLSRIITSSKPNNVGSNCHHNNNRNLKDLVNWWDHESPDWAKSSEEGENISDYINYYYPGVDFHYSEEEGETTRSKENANVKWKPDPTRHSQQQSSFQNKPTPVTTEMTDNAKWFKSFGFQSTPKVDPINEPSDFTNTPRPNKIVTRFTRQSADSNLFAVQNSPTSTFPSPTLEQCTRTCPTTSEYNPVCGTDNITYNNEGRLACARFCGVDVSIRRRSPCPESFDEGNNASPRPSTNRPATNDVITNTNFISPSLQSCMNNCPKRGETAPVCGSDGRTYDSPGHLLCVQLCGLDVRVRQLSACPSSNNLGNNFETSTQSVSPIPLSSSGSNPANSVVIDLGPKPNNNNAGNDINNSGNNMGFWFNQDRQTTTSIPHHLRTCLKSCPTTAEYNPVCGSNRILYNNPSRLQCARICGADVQRVDLSVCLPPTPISSTPEPLTNPTTPEPTTTQNPLTCTKSCRLSPETKPVCGTNGVTYRNIEYLQCVKRCGADVEVRSNSSCQDEITPQPTALSRPNPDSTKPPNNNGINFTIPPDILANVFQPLATTNTTTESPIDDEFVRINDK